jgi:hypothetical protein
MWLQDGMRAGGKFSTCQAFLDSAEKNTKFSTQIKNKNNKHHKSNKSQLMRAQEKK